MYSTYIIIVVYNIRRRHPLRLRLVACSSLNGSHPAIAYGVFSLLSAVSYTHLDVYKRQGY